MTLSMGSSFTFSKNQPDSLVFSLKGATVSDKRAKSCINPLDFADPPQLNFHDQPTP
jgi:hypothetical protein